MKKAIKERVGLIILVLFVLSAFYFEIADRTFILPKPDNTTPMKDLITRRYSEEKLESLYGRNEGFGTKYTLSVPEIKKHFKIECIRDPRIFNAGEGYLPYIVFLSDDGRVICIFFDDSLNTVGEVQFYDLDSEQDIISRAKELANENSETAEWLEHFNGLINGCWTGNLHFCIPVLSENGTVLFYVSTNRGVPRPQIEETVVFTDIDLLNGRAPSIWTTKERGWELYPILPIDKQ